MRDPKKEMIQERATVVPEEASKDIPYSDRLSYDEWISLIEDLKEYPSFKLKVKSPKDEPFRLSYALKFNDGVEESLFDFDSTIVFSLTEDRVGIDVKSYKCRRLDGFIECLFETPLKRVPLFINDKDPLIKIVSNWRLRKGI